ncbi:unnamed protein product [Cyprideis torosa]|uniref:Uncharacterized protein n=1 Tax=Cyprideis torosa TaxID=163714 RepID=A0A7R8ZJA1_9CRUS|nr:unnamed protein product [Cyprideis torosa]CAG0888113.1 unnamed protein product [Cyprideis torosa]
MSYSHMWSKYLRFVRSDRVRNNVMPYIAGGIAAVTCLTYSSLHTFFADYYVEWMRVLVRGIPMKMDPELETLVEEVREDVKKYDERAKKIRTFPVVGEETST